MKRAWSALGVIIIAAVLAAGYHAWGPREAPEGQPPLAMVTVGTFSEFQKQFNDAADQVRLLVLLSPT